MLDAAWLLCSLSMLAGPAALRATSQAPPEMDSRQAAARDVNTVTEPPELGSAAAWRARRVRLREQVRAATGVWPEQPRPAVQPHIGPARQGDGYTVANVWFESRPGLVLAGNLYRPLGVTGRRAAVLSAHGHGARGRLVDDENYSAIARSVSFARFGYVVFNYDMIGYNDTGLGLAHRDFALGRGVPMLYGITINSLQTYDSMRALDFLSALPDVDPQRIGVTGESGGGTQTFLLCAVDERPAAAAPVNMVSLQMAGGCVCENAPGLRVDTDNVEITALFAPKPLILVAATGDWTVNTPTREGPAARRAWELLGAPDNFETVQFDAPHNYNLSSREAVYAFFGRHLLGDPDASHFRERPYTAEPDEVLRVFPDDKPPAEQWPAERLIDDLRQSAQPDFGQLDKLEVLLRHSLAVEAVPPAAVLVGGTSEAPVLGRTGLGDRVVTRFVPGSPVSILVGHDPAMEVALTAGGRGLLVLEPFSYQPPRDEEANFFGCYNRSQLAARVQDVLTAAAALTNNRMGPIDLVGVGEGGPVALLAAAWTQVQGVAVDLSGLNVDDDQAFLHSLWQPGLRRAGDLRTAALLAARGGARVQVTGARGTWPTAKGLTVSPSSALARSIRAD